LKGIATSPVVSQQEKHQCWKELPRTKKTHQNLKSDLEKFIGENLFNKIGIVLLVIGVAIGAK